MSRIQLGQDQVRTLSWGGFKPLLAKLLASRPINRPLHAIARVALPRSVASRLPLNRHSVTYRLEGGGAIELLEPLHDIVARDMHWGGGQPTAASERFKLVLFERLSRKAATFLDIGAYAGIFSLIAARANPQLRAFAYEIVPENYILLARNIVANDLIKQIEPKLLGVGGAPGSLTMPRAFGAASFLPSISLGSSFEDGVSVAVVALDDVMMEVAGPVLVKIDVEGFEDEIFRGAANFMKKHKPDIVCEILAGAHDSCRTISEILQPLGYRWICFEDEGPVARDRLEAGRVMRDWLFTVAQDLPLERAGNAPSNAQGGRS